MLVAGTPLTGTRAAIVQDLYRLAFCRQLEECNSPAAFAQEPICQQPIGQQPIGQQPIGNEGLVSLLRDVADILDQTHHEDDAAMLKHLASDAAPLAASSRIAPGR